jgi:hypothetical protein
MLESSTMLVEEFFIDKPNQASWRPLSSQTLEQSPCYPIIDKRQYNNDSGSGIFYYCKLHPDIENISLESIEHHCKYRDPELHKSEILKLRFNQLAD